MGYEFTCTGSNVFVTELGCHVPTGAARDVRLWTSTGNQLAQAAVGAGTGWRFTTLSTPVPLTQGQNYVVSEFATGAGNDYWGHAGPTGWGGDSNISWVTARYAFITAHNFPNMSSGGTWQYGIAEIGYILGTAVFQAQSITVVGAPVTATPGGTFQATRAIQNTGLLAGTCNYTIRLSTDTTITTADPAVYTGTSASIAAGATDTATVTCTVPGAQTAGTYYLGLYIAGPPISTANTTNQDVIVGTFNPV
ncbi:MAG: DUF4082 domain-containing protein, partial [Planctomycetota bacterium]